MTTSYVTVGEVEFCFSDCIECGIRFAIPRTLYDNQQARGGHHTCPNGHSQGWDKKRQDKIVLLEGQLKRVSENSDYYRRQADTKDRQISALKGVATKLRNKANAPVQLKSIKGGKK